MNHHHVCLMHSHLVDESLCPHAFAVSSLSLHTISHCMSFTGLEVNPARPHSKLPYRGEWLWVGPEMIHLMELPNPDSPAKRPEVRTCIAPASHVSPHILLLCVMIEAIEIVAL